MSLTQFIHLYVLLNAAEARGNLRAAVNVATSLYRALEKELQS